MSYISEKTNSSNITHEQDSDFKFSNYYKTIVDKTDKMTNTLIRKSLGLNSCKTSRICSLNKKYGKKLSNKYSIIGIKEDNKNSNLFKDQKKNHLNMLFKNLLIREKQKAFKKNIVEVKDYNMYIKKEEPSKTQFIVSNNSSLFKSFLSQTRSNFNNKYKVVYSVSDWRQKTKVKSLLNSIKKYQHKYNFSDFLKIKLLKKCSSNLVLETLQNKNNKNIKNATFDKIGLNNNSTNDYFKDIFHKNNLIKIKTLNEIKYNLKQNVLRKTNTDIFYRNNTLFKTMPFNKLKKKKRGSFA